MKPNGEKCNREWLLYSPLKKMVYCFYCLVLKSDVMCDGYNDWKNINKIIEIHVKKSEHISAISTYIKRTQNTNKINIELEKQIIETCDYWKNVLKQLIETILFLSERGFTI